MKKLLQISAMIGTFLILITNVNAQVSSSQELTMGIPEVLLINAVNSTGAQAAVALEITTTTAGDAISGGTGTSYAQVSSIVASGETRKITASVTGVPSGTSLSVTTAVPILNFAGIIGNGTSGVSLVNSAAAVDIATGIGSCYTGSAPGDGYKLDWTWDAAIGAYGTISATSSASAIVVLTITAGQ